MKNQFETNNQSIEMFLISEQIKIIDILLDLVNKISENGRNIYE